MASRGRRGRGQPRPVYQQPDQDQVNQTLVPFIRGRQIDIGDVSGEQHAPVLATFTYFGRPGFRVNPDLNEVMVMDLLERAGEIAVDDPNQLAVAKGYVREHIHPDDFDELWDVAHQNRQGVADVLKLCNTLLERVTERPTERPSDSSDGPRDTRPSLPAGASVRDIAKPYVQEFEARGRPDLANQVMLAVEAREARGLVTV